MVHYKKYPVEEPTKNSSQPREIKPSESSICPKLCTDLCLSRGANTTKDLITCLQGCKCTQEVIEHLVQSKCCVLKIK
jgi:hypothetical protein